MLRPPGCRARSCSDEGGQADVHRRGSTLTRCGSTDAVAIGRENVGRAMFSLSPHGNHRPCRKVTAPRSAGSHALSTIVLARRRGFLAEVRSLWRDRSGLDGRVRRGRMMFMTPLKYECFNGDMPLSRGETNTSEKCIRPRSAGWASS
jgi:hypothetical protein